MMLLPARWAASPPPPLICCSEATSTEQHGQNEPAPFPSHCGCVIGVGAIVAIVVVANGAQ